MKWLNFLHFYQPPNQQKDILEAVIKESYLPIFKKIGQEDRISLTMNITGSLLELFERDNYTELLDLIRTVVREGKVELTGSCKFHAFLPLVPEKEIRRQILENNRTLERVLGFPYSPKGFFPPEMGYHPKIAPILEELSFEWVLLDEIACIVDNEFPKPSSLYVVKGTNLKVFFRNRRVSNLIMSAAARDCKTLKQSLKEEFKFSYLVTGMDGETFGHHRIGLEHFLFEIFDDPAFEIISVQDFLSESTARSLKEVTVDPKPSTWASSISDIEKGIQFLSWKDPENLIHKVQWEFLEFTLELVYGYSEEKVNYEEVRHKMDMALASDHFWWASAKPWWSLEMIEDGAFRLLDAIQSLEGISEEVLYKGYKYYMAIVSQASAWQREGIVRQMAVEQNAFLRIPFKDRTVGKGGAEEGVYWAFIDLMRSREKEAAGKGDYERATLWRDAIYKLDHKYDIYDTINVIDLLRLEVGNGRVEEVIEEYKKEYGKLRGGQPEQRGA